MRQNFESAKKLYHQKLQPRILADHGLTHEQLLALPVADARRRAFRNDDRLVKTLLLAALVSVEPLKNMTAARLVALNHGTIRAPIPGQETSLVLTKLKNWSADVGELRLQGDQANPTITLAIIGVEHREHPAEGPAERRQRRKPQGQDPRDPLRRDGHRGERRTVVGVPSGVAWHTAHTPGRLRQRPRTAGRVPPCVR